MIGKLSAVMLTAAALFAGPAQGADLERQKLSFSDLNGWESDDHASALRVFQSTCKLIKDDRWTSTCAESLIASDAKNFFEERFVPVLVTDQNKALFTGYYEPELLGARTKNGKFQHPLYALPPEMPRGKAWFTRGEIEKNGILKNRGLEIAWLTDPVENFFLHVQGSGRLRLQDGSSMRIGFAGKNGHKYRSVGKEMARRGLLADHKLSASNIKKWVRAHPIDGEQILWHNPSFIFFREISGLSEDAGPIGAMSRPVTAMRSLAVDPDFTPLGAPVWVEKKGKAPLNRLMIAQDTGSAIKGAQRADIFFGSGREAGAKAGVVRDTGRMIVLFPKGMVDG